MKIEKMKCHSCGSTDDSVSDRPDPYAQEIGNDPTAYHTACDKCNNESAMDI